MILSAKKSMGISISQSGINIALLRVHNGSVKLIKAASVPVPDGAMEDGNIKEPALLAKTIRGALRKNGITIRQAVVSLAANPVLSQILKLPEQIPSNLSQFIKSEIKRSPLLSKKEVSYDFCGLSKASGQGSGTVMVAATDQDKVYTLLRTLRMADVEPVALEISPLAAIRGLYKKYIANNYDSNVLVSFLDSDLMTTCVFRKGRLDFIRGTGINASGMSEEQIVERLQKDIEAVVNFYEIEVDNVSGHKWEFIAVLADCPVQAERLRQAITGTLVQSVIVLDRSNFCSAVSINRSRSADAASAVSVGLAMRPFAAAGFDIDIDLLPAEVTELRNFKRLFLLTANAAAFIILVMLVSTGFVKARVSKIEGHISKDRYEVESKRVEQRISEQKIIEEQITTLEAKKQSISEVVSAQQSVDWLKVFEKIGQSTPGSLYITNVDYPGLSKIQINGFSLSFQSVRLFAETLSQCGLFESAGIRETSRKSITERFISFSIECILPERTDLIEDAER